MSRRSIRVVALLLAVAALAGCHRKKTLSENLAAENKVEVRPVRLYYESQDLLLAAEKRNVPLPENPAGAISIVVRELLKGPASPANPRLLPADTVLRGAYLLPDGTALIDLGGATLSAGWGTGTHQELMAIYSIVQTVTANVGEAKRVRLLVNGEPAETLGGHISLGRAFVPAASLLDPKAP